MSWDARNCFLIAVIIYGGSTLYSIFLWRKGFRRHDHVNYFLLLAGILFHTRAMIVRGLSLQRCPVNNLYEAMTFVAWTIAAAYLVLGLFPRLRHFGAFVAPIVFGIGVFALMPALDVPYKDKPEFSNGLVSLHAALSLLSYGAFGLSAVAALMYLTLEHDLKFHKLRALLSLLPPLTAWKKSPAASSGPASSCSPPVWPSSRSSSNNIPKPAWPTTPKCPGPPWSGCFIWA